MRHIQRHRRDPYAKPPVPIRVTIVKLKTELDPHSSDAVCLGRVDSQSQGGSFGPKNNWADKKTVSMCPDVFMSIDVSMYICLYVSVFMSLCRSLYVRRFASSTSLMCPCLCVFPCLYTSLSLCLCVSLSVYVVFMLFLCLWIEAYDFAIVTYKDMMTALTIH